MQQASNELILIKKIIYGNNILHLKEFKCARACFSIVVCLVLVVK